MKPKLFVLSAATILFTTATCSAGHGYFTELGRNLGYGISDGYHATRHCLPTCQACGEIPAAQQPVLQHSMMQQSVTPQPVTPQPLAWQPVALQPGTAASYSPWTPQAPRDATRWPSYGAPVLYQPGYRADATGFGQAVMPVFGSPNRTPQPR